MMKGCDPIPMKDLILRLLQGAVIGTGAILPGVSGGVLAVTMGLYEGLVSALANFFSDWKTHLRYLFPILLGGMLGVLCTGNLLKPFFLSHETEMTLLFSGFVLGNIPWLFLEAKGESRFKKRYILSLILGFCLILALARLESALSENTVITDLTWQAALLAGAVLAVGIILPGVSASFLLLYMGSYTAVLLSIAELRLRALFFLGLGFLAMAALLLATVNRLIRAYHAISYFAIIGFSLGSIAIVLPGAVPGLSWICPFLFIFGLCISLLIGYFKARALGFLPEPYSPAADQEPEEDA